MNRKLKNPGNGRFGRMPKKPGDQAKDGGPDQIQNKLRILIVDDNQMIRKAITRLLAVEGVERENISCAENGKRALETVLRDEKKFDIILTDNQMPEMDGEGLIEELGKLGKKDILAKTVLHTSNPDSLTEKTKHAIGGRAFDKAWEREQLKDLMEYVGHNDSVSGWEPKDFSE